MFLILSFKTTFSCMIFYTFSCYHVFRSELYFLTLNKPPGAKIQRCISISFYTIIKSVKPITTANWTVLFFHFFRIHKLLVIRIRWGTYTDRISFFSVLERFQQCRFGNVHRPQQVAKHAKRHDLCLTEARYNCRFSYSKNHRIELTLIHTPPLSITAQKARTGNSEFPTL